MDLLIVESPTKAKTLTKFLGSDYAVTASMGHIRDIPGNKMNINVDGNFEPVYELSEGKAKTVAELQRLAKKAKTVYLATDPDREGEAIAYHVQWVLDDGVKAKDKKDFKRITFHQITKSAVEEAIAHAGVIDMKMVDAQQARRVLDRLVGYSLSPVLWKKVRRGLSAGRVQSVALRLIVEREAEINAFVKQEFWEVKVKVEKVGEVGKVEKADFWTDLVEVDSKALVTGKGDERKFLISSEDKVKPVIADLKTAKYVVGSVEKKERRQFPKPPYTTSTLQQAAGNSLGWTSKRTMSVAQKLYEHGHITYHRTDSFHLANEAIDMVRGYVGEKYGNNFLPEKPNVYKTKSKSAQEAHEAIRPTDVKADFSSVGTDDSERKLYALIWKRFVSCQMAPAVVDATTVIVNAAGANKYKLRTTGSILKFAGWRTVYGKGGESDTGDVVLPDLNKDEDLSYKDLAHEQKFTEPPPRYNDASLVKTLEELGIGRPSTYAPTVSTLITRGYLERKERRFYPTAVGTTVVEFLKENFKGIMDYGFTASMEDDLDKIAEGKKEWVPMLREFWKPFIAQVKEVEKNSGRVAVPVIKLDKPCPECKEGELVIRTGKFGKFISCSRFPECKFTDRYQEKIDMACPTCKTGEVVVKKTKTGRTFYGCSRYPDCEFASWNDPRVPLKEKQN